MKKRERESLERRERESFLSDRREARAERYRTGLERPRSTTFVSKKGRNLDRAHRREMREYV